VNGLLPLLSVLRRPVQTRLQNIDKTETITGYRAARATYTSTVVVVQRRIPGNLVPMLPMYARRSAADGFTCDWTSVAVVSRPDIISEVTTQLTTDNDRYNYCKRGAAGTRESRSRSVLSDDQNRDSGANETKTQNRPLSAPHRGTRDVRAIIIIVYL